MKTDPIVAEVRKQRMDILASYGGDFEKMSQDVMKRQWTSGHKVVSRAKKTSVHEGETALNTTRNVEQ